tara:strand:- start:255 stop:683 length:429 start_codon:yes stop_codon:yes gene_type:complete
MKAIFRPLSKYIDYLFTQKTKEQIRDELFLLVLSRTTSADTNIRAVEIKKVKTLLKDHLGKEYTDAQIRVAAQSKRFEKEPLHRFVGKAAKLISENDRVSLAFGMMDIMKSDDRIGALERKHFNRMIKALGLSPSSLIERAA